MNFLIHPKFRLVVGTSLRDVRRHLRNERRTPRRGIPTLGAALFALVFTAASHGQVLITRTFTPGFVIPDSGQVADVRTIAVGGGTITNLQVDLVMSGVNGPMFNGDYYVSLTHDTASAVLLNQPGVSSTNAFGYADNGFSVTFADGAANGNVHFYRDNASAAPASGGVLTGTWAPDGRINNPITPSGTATLSTFNGVAPSGQWHLLVDDNTAGGAATLDLWRLRMTVQPDGTSQLNLTDAQLTAGSSPQTIANPVAISGASLVSGPLDVTLQGQLTGSGTLTKDGAARLVLNQPSNFTGALAVTAGTLELPSGIGGTGGGITVGSGARLTASGAITRDLVHQGTVAGPALGSGQLLTFNGAVSGAGHFEGRIAMNGSFSPGNSPAITNFTGDYVLGSTHLLTMEIGGLTAGTQFDQIRVTHTLTFGGTLDVSLINSFTPSVGQSFQLFTAGTYAPSAFSTYSLPTLSEGTAWDYSLLTTTGVLSVTASAIPEPSTYAALAGLAALGLGILRRRKNK